MDEEFVKRNTDCVYFLASPLTCKKGFECEYRHSETARLNPRDCWYWMAGNCLNPACGFRHPPLDGLAETASKTAVTNHQGVAPVKKTNVPCYFYYNSLCNKGDSCPFLHGPSDIKPSGKLSKTAPLEEKTSVAADLGPAPVETPDVKVAPEIAKPEKIGPEKDLHKSTYSNVVAQSASPQPSDSASEGADVMKPNSMNRREAELSSQSTDQSTENQEEHYGREEWLESSPGFDVLVNDRTEESEHVTAVYLEQLNEEYLEHNHHQNMRFEYEDNVEYDPSYPDIRIPFRQQEMRGFYEQHGKHTCNPVKEFQMCERHRVLENNWRQKMNFLPAGVTSIDRSDMDLRDFLKRRRVVDVHYPAHYDYREQNHTVDDGRFHGRLASRVEMHYTGSQVVQKMPLSPYSIAKRDRQRRTGRSRLNNKGRKQAKRQNILSEISNKKIVKKQRSYTEESSMFTGPKTLAEIKEEKKRQHK